MADKITTTKELKLTAQFVDGDNRTLTLSNPKASLDSTTINAVATTLAEKQVLIGDKAGAAFLDFGTSAKIEETKKTVLDLSL